MRLGIPEGLLVAGAILTGGCDDAPAKNIPVAQTLSKAPVVESASPETSPSPLITAEDEVRNDCWSVGNEARNRFRKTFIWKECIIGSEEDGIARGAERDCLIQHGLLSGTGEATPEDSRMF